MKFERYLRVRQAEPPSARRLAAARRAIQRDLDSVALFPELARFKTPEERIERMDEAGRAYWQDMRNFRARKWREARRQIRELPEHLRQQVLAYWNKTNGFHCPFDPHYLLDHIHQLTRKH